MCGVLVLAAFVSLLRNCVFREPEGRTQSQARILYSSVSTEYLGNYLADKFPESRALIIFDAASNSKILQERLNGLRKGLKGKVEIVNELGLPTQLPPGVPPEMIRTIELIKASDFDSAMKNNPKANMIITLIGLPQDIQNMQIWRMEDAKKRPKMIVFGGDPEILKDAIKADYIQALVVYRQMDKYAKQKPPSDLNEAFARRFILYTPQNIAELEKAK